jgi:hypothetical protein
MLTIIDGDGDAHTMTLPDERYRALRWAESFLQDLQDPQKTPRVPRDIRRQARAVLRHYPGSYYIDELARRAPEIIAKEMEQLHRFVKSGAQGQDAAAPHPDQERDPTA